MSDIEEVMVDGERFKRHAQPSVGRIVHYYGDIRQWARLIVDSNDKMVFDMDTQTHTPQSSGPFAALVVDVGPGPYTVTLKITDHFGNDHVRANVEHGDPGWMYPPRVG